MDRLTFGNVPIHMLAYLNMIASLLLARTAV